MMRIVVDVMGTDNAPVPDLEGAIFAATASPDDEIIAVGKQDVLDPVLKAKSPLPPNLRIVYASEVITMEDKPSVVGKTKPDSSIHVGLNLVKLGEADAFVSAGNTGAIHAIAMLFSLKRIAGVKRPALSVIFRFNQHPVIFLDVGANADCKPEWLAQFAVMGSLYAKNALGIPSPRIGLMSNGEEEGKGTQLTQEANVMIHALSLNYAGNIEPADIYDGKIDVVITDGFTGNIMMKTFEATARYLVNVIRRELRSRWLSALGALLASGGFSRIRQQISADEVGGAPLLGVQGVVIIAHGSSNAVAIKSAINEAKKAVQGHIVEAITEQIQSLDATHERSS